MDSRDMQTASPDLWAPVVRVVDDEESVRNSIAFNLRAAGLQAAVFGSAEEFLEKDDARHPGCVILDIRMPGMSGIELQKEMLARGIDLPVLFLTGHGDVSMAVSTLKLGAEDFLEKPAKPERLRAAAARMIEKNAASRRRALEVRRKRELFATLTAREQEIARCVAADRLNKQIAADLGIQEHTVKIHRSSACRKLGVRSALELHHFLEAIGEDSRS